MQIRRCSGPRRRRGRGRDSRRAPRAARGRRAGRRSRPRPAPPPATRSVASGAAVPWEAREIRKPRPEVVGGPRDQGRGRPPRRLRTDPGRDSDRCALPGLQVALRDELIVGRRHHATGDTEVGGQAATRRQPASCLEAPDADRIAQAALELLVQRQVVAAVDLQEEVNWPSPMSHNWNCTRGQWRRTVGP